MYRLTPMDDYSNQPSTSLFMSQNPNSNLNSNNNNNNHNHNHLNDDHYQHKLIKINNDTSTSVQDSALALLLPLLVLLSSLLFLLLLFLIFLIILRRRRSHPSSSSSSRRNLLRLSDHDGPLDLSLSEEAEIEGGIQGLERRWLESCSTSTRNGYLRAQMYQTHHRPNSLPTDITLSQFLSIQEKGVSAWAFEPDYDSNPSLPILVQSRTEIVFLADGAGMSEEEGGGVCVQSNLPLPRLNEVYYFECKIYDKPDGSEVAIGLATKPYPNFRLPGWNRLSVGYFSADGFKCHNYPFTAASYGPPLKQGDVLGVGYRPRTGAVFFTRNGKKLDDAYVGLSRFNLFPTIGATGPASVHVNLGQAGFVFIEANVKKWGLAPMAGTLAPPPAYGHQMGSILLASAQEHQSSLPHSNDSQPQYQSPSGLLDSDDNLTGSSSAETVRAPQRRRHRLLGYSSIDTQTPTSESLPHNPPTPRPLDISLEQLTNQSNRIPGPSSSEPTSDDEDDNDGYSHSECPRGRLQPDALNQSHHPSSSLEASSRSASRSHHNPHHRDEQSDVQPPQYAPIDPYKYAAGVAEVMLSEQFQGTSHSFNISRSRS